MKKSFVKRLAAWMRRSNHDRSVTTSSLEPLEPRVLLSTAPVAPSLLDASLEDLAPVAIAAPVVEASTAHVVGRHIFYNNSVFDGDDPAANNNDDHSIAPSPSDASEPRLGKQALLLGQTASFQNYTSYSRGINGIMVDVADLAGSLGVSDFQFQVGNHEDPSSWEAAPPLSEPMSIRSGDGVAGSDRYTFIWANNSIQNQWLRVTVHASDIGVGVSDLFYFGNMIGETGDRPDNAIVDARDAIDMRANATGPWNPTFIDNPYDFNRDQGRNLFDFLLSLHYWQTPADPLELMTASLFDDADVEDAVRDALGIQADTPVTPQDALDLTSLSIDSNVVSSLGGLEFATNLETLTLSPTDFSADGDLSSLAPLSGLEHLETLTIQGGGVDSAELATLGSVPPLQSLDLRYNELTDLDAISNLPLLKTLSVYGNPLDDVTALAGTLIDVDLTPVDLHKAKTVDELAAAFHHLPIPMFEYVLNNFEFEIYDGSMKGSQAVLETMAGNDWDIASLLSDMLNASGVATRYVDGRVEASLGQLNTLVGTANAQAGIDALLRAGLNPEVVSLPGDPEDNNGIRFDHLWLEAQLQLPGQPAEWMMLDATWKNRKVRPGIPDIQSLVPFDEAGYLSQVREESIVEFYRDQVSDYLQNNLPGTTVADVSRLGTISRQLVDTLPYPPSYSPIGSTTTFTVIPDDRTHRVEVSLTQGGSDLFRHRLVLPETVRNRITIGYQTDPGGLIPRLMLDGVVVATGSVVGDRSEVLLTLDHYEPDDDVVDNSFDFTREAGQPIAVGIDGRQISDELLAEARHAVNDVALARLNGEPYSEEDQVGGVLSYAIMKWLYDTRNDNDVINGLFHAVEAAGNLMTMGVTSSEPTTTFHSDVQIPFIPDELAIDMPFIIYHTVSADGDESLHYERRRMASFNSSYRESAVFEELVNIDSISTVKSLQLANERGIPIIMIDPANINLVDTLTHSDATKDQVRSYIQSTNGTVTIPRDPTNLQDWEGVGFFGDSDAAMLQAIAGGLPTPTGIADPGFSAGGDATGIPNIVPSIFPPTRQAVQQHVGDPINIANGSVTHDEFDISLPGVGIPLQFGRFYDSSNDQDKGMGDGWSFSYSDRLDFDSTDGSVTWLDGSGNRFLFTPDGGGGFVTPESIYGTLTDEGSAFVWEDKTGMRHEFDAAGKLTKIQDRYGNGYAIAHDASDQIMTVADLITPSRSLTFGYTDGHVSSVSDFTGRTWSYGYTGGRLSLVTSPSDADTPLAKVQYTYYTDTARDGLLHEVIAPDGGVTDYSYYANRRGFQVTDPEGFSHTVSYNTFRNQTAFTDERDNTSVYTYNDQANLVHLLRPDGSTMENVWLNNLLQSTTDSFGETESYQYDSRGNRTQIIDRAGFVTTLEYVSPFSHLTFITRPAGRTTKYVYNEFGDLIRIKDAEQHVITMTPDSRGRMITRTSPKGSATALEGDYTTTFTYNDAGQTLTSSTDLPSIESFTYSGRGNMLTETDARNHTTTFTYNLLDRQLTQTDHLGGLIKTAFDSMGNLVEFTDELLRVTEFEHDLRQRQTLAINAVGAIVTSGYNAFGGLSFDVDELGRGSWFGYDSRNRLVSTVFPDETVDRIEFDGNSRIVRTVDARGNATRFSFDDLDRLVTTTDAHDQTTIRDYDKVGNLLTFTDELGRVTTHIYDKRNLRTSITEPDPDGNGPLQPSVTKFKFDANRNLVRVTDPLNHMTSFGYDLLDRQVTTTDALNKVTTKTHDAVGNIESITDPETNTTSYTFDELNRQVTDTNELGHTRTFGYDAASNMTSLVDRNGQEFSFGFDSLNRQVSETWLDTNSDPIREMNWVFDVAGQLVAATDPDASYFFEFDEMSRLINVQNGTVDAAETNTLANNIVGELALTDFNSGGFFLDIAQINAASGDQFHITLTSEDFNIALLLRSPSGVVTPFDDTPGFGTNINESIPIFEAGTWDIFITSSNAGQLGDYQLGIALTTPPTVDIVDGVPRIDFSYSYGPNGNLVRAEDSRGGVVRYEHDELNRMVEILQGGVGVVPTLVDFVFDEASQLESVSRYTDASRNSLVATSTYTFDDASRLTRLKHTNGGTTIAQYDHVYDAANRMKSMTGPDGSSSYSYDATNQLTGANHSFQADESYSFDDNGNRTNVGYNTTSNNELQSDGVYTFVHDNEGRRTSRIHIATGELTEYEWDHRDRLTGVVTKNAGGQVTKDVQYTYDIFDDRITKSIDGVLTHFVFDGDNIALVFDDSGNLIHRYNHGPGVDEILSDQTANGTVNWALTDHQGTMRDIVSDAGVVLNHIEYDSFGIVTAESNPAVGMLFGFTGRERDTETGLQYNRARYYDPSVGRFISQDPSGFRGNDANLYRYAYNSPLIFLDPTGLQAYSGTAGQAIASANSNQTLEQLIAQRGRLAMRWQNVQEAKAKAGLHSLSIPLNDPAVTGAGVAFVVAAGRAGKLVENLPSPTTFDVMTGFGKTGTGLRSIASGLKGLGIAGDIVGGGFALSQGDIGGFTSSASSLALGFVNPVAAVGGNLVKLAIEANTVRSVISHNREARNAHAIFLQQAEGRILAENKQLMRDLEAARSIGR